MKSKRGQGLPMNSIVIAAIVLVVMVVLIMIFSGSMGKWLQNLNETTAGKTCVEFKGTDNKAGAWHTGPNCPKDYIPIYNVRNADDHPGQVCCVKG